MAWWTRTGHNRTQGDLLFNDPDGWVIEEPQLRWLGSDQLGALLSQGSGGVGAAGGGVGLDIAEPGNSFPAITRATTLICDSLASTRWNVMRGRDILPTPRWLADPALSRPDGRISDWTPTGRNPLGPVSFWSQVILSALWYGDAFVWVGSRSPETGQPIPPLLLLHPLLVDIVPSARNRNDDREPGYWVRNPDDENDQQRLLPSEVIHIPGMGPYWGGRGRGALTGHMKSWAEATAQRNYSTGLFSAGIPAGYLKVTAPNLTPTQADELREAWMEKHGTQLGQRDIAVLNAVTDFVAVQLSPEAAQMGDARRQSTLDVANAFGVEPYMLGLPSDNATYANIESRMRHFVQFTLLPWARRIEGALDGEFPQGTELRLDLDSMARADTGTRISYYESGLTNGWLTIDEVRHAEGLPELPKSNPPPVALVEQQPNPEEGAA